MEFLEGGVYRPIRVLFDTPIYDRALQLCWTITSYKTQIALLRELLSLQQKNQIPSQVTAEDMISVFLEESKNTVRERLWEFELEDFDEEDAKPLLKLVWAVNVNNKMRDVEFEAKMLLNSPEGLPPNFRHPKVLSTAKSYAKILREKQREAPSSKQLCPQEVVIEVVPRVLQGFWALPPRLLLTMPSQRLSKMSVGVTKAVLDRVSNALTSMGCQATFSRSIRDEVVLSILTEIRQRHPHDILVNRIKSFAPVLLTEIVDVAAGQIIGMFQPQSSKMAAHLTPAVEPPAATPVQEDLNLCVAEEPSTSSPEANSAMVSTPPNPPTPPSEPLSITDVEAGRDEQDTSSLQNNPEPTRELDSAAVSPTPPADPPSFTDVEAREDGRDEPCLEHDEHTREPESAAVPSSPTLPADTPSFTDVEAREDGNDKPYLENDKPSREPASAVVPLILTPPADPPSFTDVEAREHGHDKPYLDNDKPSREPASAAAPPIMTPPAEPPSVTDVEARETENDKPNPKNNTNAISEAASAAPSAPPAPLTPPAEPVILTAEQDGLTTSLAEIEQPASSSAEVSPPPAPQTSQTEPPRITDVQDREETCVRPSTEESQTPSTEPASVQTASPASLTPPLEPLVTVTAYPVNQRRMQGFFRRLFRSLCCCFVTSDTETERE